MLLSCIALPVTDNTKITSLRTSFTVNSNMKRLFLADTQLQSEGAIALAEFLPEAKTLLHVVS